MAKIASLLTLEVLLLGCFGCSRELPTSVRVSAGPHFALSGSGRLASFTIYGPKAGQRIAFPHPDVASVLWQIKASAGYFKGARVEGLQLKYGEVPNDYKLAVPGQQQQSLPLSPGIVYSFFAETTDAPAVDGFFYMDETGTFQTRIPDLCLKLVNGREVRVNCKTDLPYEEPSNLEEMVHKNKQED
jgi:hypothetical protein